MNARWMDLRRWIWWPLAACLIASAPVAAQESSPPERLERTPTPERTVRRSQPWRTRLLEADRLLRIGSHTRAARVLDQAEALGAPAAQVRRYRIELAQAADDPETVIVLCREGLDERAGQPRLLRPLARALMDLDRLAEARRTLQDLFAASPNRASTVAEAVLMWRQGGHPAEGLALCDSLRRVRDEDRLFMRQRAACLLDLDRVEEGLGELARELALNPLNLPMVRESLWDQLLRDDQLERARAALAAVDDGTGPELALLRVDLRLRLGDADGALDEIRPHLAESARLDPVLRFASALAREADIQTEARVQRAAAAWLIEVFTLVVGGDHVPRNQRMRVADLLAGVCLDALERGHLDTDPERATRRLVAALDLVRRHSPGSTRLYTAQIRLAAHTRDVLGRPADAARRLEGLLTDLNLPLEGVALARLALGECHLAAGDTARARVVLSRLGQDTRFTAAAAGAHALLGRLDFAQGEWELARDRLAAVALDDPRGDWVNDALDLGLLIAEELVNPTGGPHRLEAYAPCVYWELRGRDEARRDALEHFLAQTPAEPGTVDHLHDRARLELARLLVAAGETDRGAELCRLLASERPDGLRAAAALYLRGETLLAAGDDREGREVWERLLVQYPESLEADDARAKLRSLP